MDSPPLLRPVRGRLAALQCLLPAVLGGWACGGAPDPAPGAFPERCLHALEYRLRDARELQVDQVHPRGSEVEIAYRARSGLLEDLQPDRMACRFDAVQPWGLREVRVSGEAVSRTELLLIEADLLLADARDRPWLFQTARETSSR